MNFINNRWFSTFPRIFHKQITNINNCRIKFQFFCAFIICKLQNIF